MSTPKSTPDRARHTRRMPSESLFYDRIFPLILVALAVVMIVLIVIAAGVILGLVHYQ